MVKPEIDVSILRHTKNMPEVFIAIFLSIRKLLKSFLQFSPLSIFAKNDLKAFLYRYAEREQNG